jgi:flagellin-like hook-associated protein FlgL
MTTQRSQLMVQAASATYTFENRQTIARVLELLKGQIHAELNGTFAGRYVFSGFRTDQPPIVTQNNLTIGVGTDNENIVDMDISKYIHINDFNDAGAVFWRDPANPDILQVVVTTEWLNRPDRERANWEDDPNVRIHVVGHGEVPTYPALPNNNLGINILRLPYQYRFDANGDPIRTVDFFSTMNDMIAGIPIVPVSIDGSGPPPGNPYIPRPGQVTFIRETGELVVHSLDLHIFGTQPAYPGTPPILGAPASLPFEFNFPITGEDLTFSIVVNGNLHSVTFPEGTILGTAINPAPGTALYILRNIPGLTATGSGNSIRVSTLEDGYDQTLSASFGGIRTATGWTTPAGGSAATPARLEFIMDFPIYPPTGHSVSFTFNDGAQNFTREVNIPGNYDRDHLLEHLRNELASDILANRFDIAVNASGNIELTSATLGSQPSFRSSLGTSHAGSDPVLTGNQPQPARISLGYPSINFPIPTGGLHFEITIGYGASATTHQVTIPAGARPQDARNLLNNNIPGLTVGSGNSPTITFSTVTPYVGPDATLSVAWHPNLESRGRDGIPGTDPRPPGEGPVLLTYNINGYFAGELNPRVFFESHDLVNDIRFRQDNQDIQYELGTNVHITINTQARNAYPWQLFSDMSSLLHWVNNISLSESPPADAEQLARERAFFGEQLYTKFTNTMSRFDRHMQTNVTEFTALGARMDRVEMITVRLDENEDTFRALRDQNENIDYLEIITQFNAAEAVLQAAMQAGARVSQLSLINFI